VNCKINIPLAAAASSHKKIKDSRPSLQSALIMLAAAEEEEVKKESAHGAFEQNREEVKVQINKNNHDRSKHLQLPL